jgi:hypothetical protein
MGKHSCFSINSICHSSATANKDWSDKYEQRAQSRRTYRLLVEKKSCKYDDHKDTGSVNWCDTRIVTKLQGGK